MGKPPDLRGGPEECSAIHGTRDPPDRPALRQACRASHGMRVIAVSRPGPRSTRLQGLGPHPLPLNLARAWVASGRALLLHGCPIASAATLLTGASTARGEDMVDVRPLELLFYNLGVGVASGRAVLAHGCPSTAAATPLSNGASIPRGRDFEAESLAGGGTRP